MAFSTTCAFAEFVEYNLNYSTGLFHTTETGYARDLSTAARPDHSREKLVFGRQPYVNAT